VLFLSNLNREKGLFTVLEAAKYVVDRRPQTQFILAGAWFRNREKERALRMIEELHLDNRVKFVGTVEADAKWRLLLNSDVFVFPPVAAEGLGLVILEAMSAGLPVVVTPQGAIPEVVVDEITGYIVPPGDPVSLSERVISLLQDEALRKRMGQAGRERFLKYYTLDRWAKDMLRVFQEVLEEH